MTDTEAIGRRVDERMAVLKMDARTLAKAIGVTEDTIYRLLRGETVKQWVRLAKIAGALRTTPNNLLGVDSPASRERQSELMSAAFRGLGLPEPLDRNLSEICLEALDTPPGLQSGVSDQDRMRIAAETLRRQSAVR